MNNEIHFIFENKKTVLDNDPFETHNGYFYLPDGRVGHANNLAELLRGQIEVKNNFDCPKSKFVPAFTVRMQDFDVEFDQGIPVRFWLERKNNQGIKKIISEEELLRAQKAAQKICNTCQFGQIDKQSGGTFGDSVKSFVKTSDSNLYYADVLDLYQQWVSSPR